MKKINILIDTVRKRGLGRPEKIHKGYALNELKTVSNLLEHPS